MKKLYLFSVILCLSFGVRILGTGTVYPPNNIPFAYDPNAVEYKILCGIDVRAGQEVIVAINCYDPDGDPYSIRVLNWQAGMNLAVSNDPNNPTELKWTPTNEQAGLHYINIEAWDFPPDPNDSLIDRGTLVFNVRLRNRPPVLLPCGG